MNYLTLYSQSMPLPIVVWDWSRAFHTRFASMCFSLFCSIHSPLCWYYRLPLFPSPLCWPPDYLPWSSVYERLHNMRFISSDIRISGQHYFPNKTCILLNGFSCQGKWTAVNILSGRGSTKKIWKFLVFEFSQCGVISDYTDSYIYFVRKSKKENRGCFYFIITAKNSYIHTEDTALGILLLILSIELFVTITVTISLSVVLKMSYNFYLVSWLLTF